MKILDFPGLSKRLLAQLPVTGVLDGDPARGIDYLIASQRRGFPRPPYQSLYAVESGELLSQVDVICLTLTTTEGRFSVPGIANVATRPMAQRRGCAGALLAEVHRREAARGARWSFLWTHRSWGAHRLYERLGYVDLYSPPASLKRVPASASRKLPKGYRWRVVQRAAAPRLDRILQRATGGRIGFVPRFSGSFRARFAMGWKNPENLRILLHGSSEVGYAYLSYSDPWSLSANEVVVLGAEHHAPMVRALEATARGRWLALETTTFVSDAAPVLRSRGFSTYPSTHRTLMGKPLEGGDRRPALWKTTFHDPLFSNHHGDMF
jgi:GNAT superfamily N-acetyltransferase